MVLTGHFSWPMPGVPQAFMKGPARFLRDPVARRRPKPRD